MAGAAEDLEGERLVHPARSFLQETGMVLFRVGDSAERRAKTYADAVLRPFARIGDAGIIERHFRRGDGKLRVAIEPFQTMRRKVILGDPIQNLTGAMRVELGGIKARYGADPAFLRAQSAPEIFATDPDASDGTDAGDNCATFRHAGFGVQNLAQPGSPDAFSSSAASCSRRDG